MVEKNKKSSEHKIDRVLQGLSKTIMKYEDKCDETSPSRYGILVHAMFPSEFSNLGVCV
jgi:hypothetical protein